MAKEKIDIYKPAKVICSCGETFDTFSTKEEINVEVCSKCHPFYTGQQTRASKSSKIEKFNAKYGLNKDTEEK